MLSCLSIGISEYKNEYLTPIPCAQNDAHAVYDAFKQIMGDEFNTYLSVCVSNIRKTEFESLLTIVSDVIDSDSNSSESVLVVYFSGHGQYNDQVYELLFKDFEGSGRDSDDTFPVGRFSSIFRGKRVKILIILDCCYSGAALDIARGIDQGTQISVLASANSYGEAKFDEDGSVFTKVLCRSIHQIDYSGDGFSLRSLVERILDNGYSDAFVHRGAAQEMDLPFKRQTTDDGSDKYFSTLFVNKIARSNMLIREALWYSLNDFPDKKIFDTCSLYFDVDGIYPNKLAPEANWLVRRAIGSTLANHISYQSIRSLLYKLLESEYWQEQCIALIGLRYLIRSDDDVFQLVIRLVKEKKIARVDAVWLASLYTSDNPSSNWNVFLDTTLALTSWGMVELCKAHGLFEKKLDDYDSIRNHRYYNELIAEQRRRKKDCVRFEKYIYGGNTRGRLPENSKVKFLLSALYGNWRDQIILNLKPYIDRYGQETVTQELQDFSNVCNAERKMAIFAYFNKEYDEAILFSDALKWGLEDAHPWVRRAAITFYQELGTDNNLLMDSLFSIRFDDGYPGLLDLFLACPARSYRKLIDHLKSNKVLTNADLDCLVQALSCE